MVWQAEQAVECHWEAHPDQREAKAARHRLDPETLETEVQEEAEVDLVGEGPGIGNDIR